METWIATNVHYIRTCDLRYVASLSSFAKDFLQGVLLEKCRLAGNAVGSQEQGIFHNKIVVHWTNIDGQLYVNRIEDFGFLALMATILVDV